MTTPHDTFARLHQAGTFLLVNVHDAGSALIAQSAGAVALGTTSSGHAYSIGRKDGAGALSREESIERVAQICAAVDIPVSIDAENGWGHSPQEVAATITDLAAIGASGASIEDWSGDSSIGFYDRMHARERVAAAVEAAAALPQPFVICARAEAFLYGADTPMTEALARLQSFTEVGADCLYAPGTTTAEELATVVDEAGGPVNGLLGLGGSLTMADAEAVGVRRVSIGGSLYQSTITWLRSTVQQLVATGDFGALPVPISDEEIEALIDGGAA